MIVNLYRKIRWFFINFKQIDFSHKLIDVSHIDVPDVFLGPLTYATDSLATSNNCDFIGEPSFARAYAAAAATNPWQGFTSQWRTYIVCWMADMVKGLEGDYVECGVNTGAYSIAAIKYIAFEKLDKTFYLLDTYEGLEPSLITDKEKEAGIEQYLSHYKNVYDEVIQTFKDYNARVIKGIVPYSLNECDATKICYLSIDMNSVEPEIAAMYHFWDKVVSGGVIILDDYGFPMHKNQKMAFDAFVKEKEQHILCLPTGQGIIIKK
jgi:O-methyltransferase